MTEEPEPPTSGTPRDGAGFTAVQLPDLPDSIAPDGSDVRVLVTLRLASMAHFTLSGGATSIAVRHRTVSEMWYVVSGRGQMWRSQDDRSEVVDVSPGTALTIPVGTSFQFRAAAGGPLAVLGVTTPPWPGAGEAEAVPGPWPPTVGPAPA